MSTTLRQVGFASLGYAETDFTGGECEAIDARVDELIADGQSEDRALALAIKECAPTKAQAKASIGGNYEWSRNADGTYNVFDVPVFAKHVRKLGMRLVADAEGNPKVEEVTVNVDEKWLNRAIELNRRRYDQEQYLGPLHVRHHPKGDDVPDTTEPAGHFLLKYVKTVRFEGDDVPMLYTDWLRIPEAVFKRIQSGSLPYRSIESLPPKFEEIDSIALLETDVPWFRLPLTSVGREIQREVYASVTAGSPFRGFARAGIAWSALTYQAGETFKERGKADEEGDDKSKKKPAASGDDKGRMDDEAEDGLTDDMSDDQMESSLGGDTMSKILEALQAIAKGQEMVLARLGGAAQAPSPQPGDVPAVESQVSQRNQGSPAAFDAAEGAALKAIVYSMKAKQELTEKVHTAMSKLAEYNLGPDAAQNLLDEALKSSDADRVIATYVATIEKHATKMPPPAWSSQAASRSGIPIPPPGEKVPEELREFFAQSPEDGAKALAAWKGYDEALKMGVIHKSMSRKDFVKYNLTKDYSALVAG